MFKMKIITRITAFISTIALIGCPLLQNIYPSTNSLIVAKAGSLSDFNSILYKADLYSKEDEIPNKTIKSYINFDSPSVVLTKSAMKNISFQLSVSSWELLTFESEKIPDQYVDKVGYYETILFKALDSYYDSSIIK